jgi:hypothetical protein
VVGFPVFLLFVRMILGEGKERESRRISEAYFAQHLAPRLALEELVGSDVFDGQPPLDVPVEQL